MHQSITQLANAFQQAGGTAYFVGGTTRNRLLKLPVKDYDLEVFGLDLNQLRTVAKNLGPLQEVGKAFGILKLQLGGHEVDLAAPRREKKTGTGHTGFDIQVDPSLPPEQAARRRDFTVNAIYENVLTGEIIDPYNGRGDLENQILRAVDPTTFVEDPLRVLRGCQLAARFAFEVEASTLDLMKRMAPSTVELSGERLKGEWNKLFLKSNVPSIGLALAMNIGLFKNTPISLLPDTPQDAETHPEGSVWAHTLLTVDRAASALSEYHPDQHNQLVVLLGAFLHDVGKATTTKKEPGGWIAHRHASEGAAAARDWMKTQGYDAKTVSQVEAIVREHMHLFELELKWPEPGVSDGALRKLVNRLSPATPEQLLTVREADFRGRGPSYATAKYLPRTWLMPRLKKLGLELGPSPILRGQDLIDRGWKPNATFKQLIQIAEAYAEEENLDRPAILKKLGACESIQDALKLFQSDEHGV